MVVVPIVFCSIALGVSQLGSGHKLGRVSTKTLGYFVATSTISATLGMLLVQIVRPGDGFDPSDQAALLEQYRGDADEKRAMAEQQRFWPDVIVGTVSRNPLKDAVELNMIPIIVTAILFGVALASLRVDGSRGDKPDPIFCDIRILGGLGHIFCIVLHGIPTNTKGMPRVQSLGSACSGVVRCFLYYASND